MQQQVHRGEPRGAVDELVTVGEPVGEVIALRGGEPGCVPGGVLVRCQKESGRPGRGVRDGVVRSGLNAVDDGLDERPGGEVLPGAGLDVLGSLREKLLVGVALDVGAGCGPVLLVDEVNDEPLQLRRVLDPVLRLTEDRAEGAGLPRQAEKDLGVRGFELGALGVQELLPGVLLRHDLLRLQRPGGALVGHLEEQQVRELLGVLNRPDAVVT